MGSRFDYDPFEKKCSRNGIMAQPSKDHFDVSPEFIESGKSHSIPKRRGGPFSKDEKIKRQNEVHRLHFEYGYSARKISELLNVSRNTVNSDMVYWYRQVAVNHDYTNPEPYIIADIERLEAQRTRLRERLDTAQNFQQTHATEKMIFDIDSKIINIRMKLGESSKQIHKEKIDYINDYLKSKGDDGRYLNFGDRVHLSVKAHERISKIIKDDEMNFNGNNR